MPPRRLALIIIITVVILIIAVFLWLIFGLIMKKNQPGPEQRDPEIKSEMRDAERHQEILNSLEGMDKNAYEREKISSEKRQAIIDALDVEVGNTPAEKEKLEDRKSELIEALKMMGE